jgi:flagellar biosynthesis protein
MQEIAPQNTVADEILRLARENDIPLRHDSALAGALATLDAGRQIPPELFRAVAEVLAFVYRVNGKA